MRLHTYSPATTDAVTLPDVDAQSHLPEVLDIEVTEHIYRVGDEQEIDLTLSLIEIFGGDHGHVIKHPCRRVTVTVVYTGRNVDVAAHPAETFDAVQARAVHELRITEAVAADLLLRVPGSTRNLDPNAPIGSAVPHDLCAVTLDLVHQARPQGGR